jgi:hypothetical protein
MSRAGTKRFSRLAYIKLPRGFVMKISLLAAAAAIAVGAAPASAVTFVTTGNTGVNGSYGNAAIYTSQTGGFQLRASAWHAVLDPNGFTYTITNAYLGQYGGGLGVTAVNDSNGANNLHTADNHQGFDFVLLQFDRTVTLTGADLNTYSINGSTDNDAWVGAGKTNLAWTSTINLAAAANNLLTQSLISGGASIKSSAGTPAARSFTSYSTGRTGNVWIIGADFKNTDGIDGFKITNILANAAVPEPATWGMMIAGFGLAGTALRRRKTNIVFA